MNQFAPRVASSIGYVFGLLCVACVGVSDNAVDSTSHASEPEQVFLTSDGIGSAEQATAYYAAIDESLVPGEYSLDDWRADYLGEQEIVSSLYQNAHELGFWREMNCTRYVGRGIGGCWVRNWNSPDEVNAGGLDLGTVAMNVSREGFTRFYVFAPGGTLAPAAILDDEGEKFVPEVCIACHNGSVAGPEQGADVRAIFREFEPSMLEAAPGQEKEVTWYVLNQTIRSANASLRREKEGGPLGIDHPAVAQDKYIRAMYPSTSPPVSLDVRDPAHLPPSWSETLNVPPTVVAAKRELWTEFVAPYCMTCHRTNDTDWADYARFEYLALDIGGKPFIDFYIAGEDDREPGFAYMPQAKLLYDEMRDNPVALAAVENWVDALGGPTCEVGMACKPAAVCRTGAISHCGPELPGQPTCQPGAPVPDGTPCGSNATCKSGACTPTLVLTIPQVPSRVYVRNQGPGVPEQHVHLHVGGGKLFVRQVDTDKMCSRADTEAALSCHIPSLTCTNSATGDAWTVVAGGTVERKNDDNPEVAGTYRIESPLEIPPCP